MTLGAGATAAAGGFVTVTGDVTVEVLPVLLPVTVADAVFENYRASIDR